MLKAKSMFMTCLALGASAAQGEMHGDTEAIAMAEQIVASIGGREVWTRIRSMYMMEKSRTLNGDGVIGEFWRDLQQPRERYTLRNRAGRVIEFWWNGEGVWQRVDGQLNTELPANLHAEVTAYWAGEIYVMYRKFAIADDDLRLVKNEDNSFTAHSRSLQRELGRFWVNGDGELYRWRHQDGTEYIYGPHKRFGAISFPDWGTQVDGSWSFYYVEVRGSTDTPPVSFDPPRGAG